MAERVLGIRDNDNSRDLSCSKPSLYIIPSTYHKRPSEGELNKWLQEAPLMLCTRCYTNEVLLQPKATMASFLPKPANKFKDVYFPNNMWEWWQISDKTCKDIQRENMMPLLIYGSVQRSWSLKVNFFFLNNDEKLPLLLDSTITDGLQRI